MQHSDQLEYWIHKVRNNVPVLEEEQKLTDDIMAKIHRNNHQSKYLFLLIWVKRVSTLAAVLLLGCFLIQQSTLDTPLSQSPKACITDINQIKKGKAIPMIKTKSTMDLYALYIKRLREKKNIYINQINLIVNHRIYENKY